MKLYLLLIVAFSSIAALATPVDVVRMTVEMRQLSPSQLASTALYRRRGGRGGGRSFGGGVKDIGGSIIDFVESLKTKDNENRENFVRGALGKYGKLHPGCNIIVVHTDLGYDKNFQGKEGGDWGKAHEEVSIKIGGRSKGYDIFWFKKGTFVRHGDGGWLNWGYTGSPKRQNNKLTYT